MRLFITDVKEIFMLINIQTHKKDRACDERGIIK